MYRTLPLLSALLLAPAAPSVAPRPKSATPRLTPPETRAQGYRFVVERFIQQQNLNEDFAADKPSETSGRQHLYLWLAVHPPDPKLTSSIQGLDTRIIAFAAPHGKVITLRSYPPEDAGPLLDGVWRTQLAAQELDLSIAGVDRLQGELVVFPRAKKVTLDFALPITGAATKESEGFKVTVKNVRPKPGGLTATVDSEWPSTHSVSVLNPDAPGGITGLTAAGTPIIPNGAGTSGSQRGNRVTRTQNISLGELKELPTKIRVEVLVRSGVPKKIPFTLPNIALPDTLDLEAAVIASGDDPSVREHPFFAETGGRLVASVTGPASARGKLLAGLARQEGAAPGAIRWLELPVDRQGRAVLANLRAGRYRITLAWSPERTPGAEAMVMTELPRAARVLSAPITVEILAGKTVTLPAVDAGGSR
ncbi:MAG: hypothetical protein ACO1SX_03740 [Actinomycetota bacterium]